MIPPILIVWLVIHAVGIGSAVELVRRARNKRIAIIARAKERLIKPSKTSILLSNRHIRESSLRTLFHAGGLVVGIWAIFDWNAAPPVTRSIMDIVTAWMLVGIAGLVALASLWDLQDDNEMTRLLQSETDALNPPRVRLPRRG